jgi:hypothetical protein
MNTLETHVLQLIGEDPDSPDVFLDTDDGMAPIRDSLNDAIEEIAIVTGSVKRTYILPLRTGTNWYRINMGRDKFAWVTDAWLVGIGRRLEQKDFHWLINYNPRWMYNTGSPERYCPIGKDHICIHPAPSSDTDMLELTVVVSPDRYKTDDQRIKLRDEFHWAAVHYAVGEYWAGRGDAATARTHHGIYIKKLGIIELYPETAERAWRYKTEKTVQ